MHRASLYVVGGAEALAAHDPGGLEVLDGDAAAFDARPEAGQPHAQALAHRPAPVQRHRQRLLRRDPARGAALAVPDVPEPLGRREPPAATRRRAPRFANGSDRLREQAGGEFPAKVTAFHDEMAVHGRYGKPCPRCGSPVQRIVYAANEANYCATCQTDGRLLADRALSRLLKKDWPRTLDELERRRSGLEP